MSRLLSPKRLGVVAVLAGLALAANGANATPAAHARAAVAPDASATVQVDSRHHHHGGGRIIIRPYGLYGGPYYAAPYYAAPSYGSRCGWLRERARDTGSRYWWRRYRECIDD